MCIRNYYLALLPLLLAGCATTQSLKPADCQVANWKAVGYQDGLKGASSQEILRHARTCQGRSIPNREQWEMGRQKGLVEYCTKKNAYELGRQGITISAVCEQNLEELHHANMMGLEQYEMSERINRLQRPYGYTGVWLHPYWW